MKQEFENVIVPQGETIKYKDVSKYGDLKPSVAKKIFVNELEKVISGDAMYDEDEFFCRPDCIAMMWWKLKRSWDSNIENPILNWLEASIITLINHESCNYEWCTRTGPIPEDIRLELIRYVGDFKYEKNCVFEYQSIKQLAFQAAGGSEECIPALMYRTLSVEADDYYDQGWPGTGLESICG